jgi:hypothetical protein
MSLPPPAPTPGGATKPPKKENVEIIRVVGSGTFGVVRLGSERCLNPQRSSGDGHLQVYEGVLEKSQRKVPDVFPKACCADSGCVHPSPIRAQVAVKKILQNRRFKNRSST